MTTDTSNENDIEIDSRALDLAERYGLGPIKDRRTGRRTRPCHTPNRTVRKKILKKVKKK